MKSGNMGLLAIIAVPFKVLGFLFKVLGFLFKHPKVFLLVGILVFVGFAVMTCSNVFAKKPGTVNVPVTAYQKTAPGMEIAPFMLDTDTRVYYIGRYTDAKTTITLNDYWIYNTKTWERKTDNLPLYKKLYPGARLYDRTTSKLLMGF